jgi:hypothetical protein
LQLFKEASQIAALFYFEMGEYKTAGLLIPENKIDENET